MAQLVFKSDEFKVKKISMSDLQMMLSYLVHKYETKKEVSKALGISKNVLNLWQTNKKIPNNENMQKIIKLYEGKK